jgi:hypothetical protein
MSATVKAVLMAGSVGALAGVSQDSCLSGFKLPGALSHLAVAGPHANKYL